MSGSGGGSPRRRRLATIEIIGFLHLAPEVGFQATADIGHAIMVIAPWPGHRGRRCGRQILHFVAREFSLVAFAYHVADFGQNAGDGRRYGRVQSFREGYARARVALQSVADWWIVSNCSCIESSDSWMLQNSAVAEFLSERPFSIRVRQNSARVWPPRTASILRTVSAESRMPICCRSGSLGMVSRYPLLGLELRRVGIARVSM